MLCNVFAASAMVVRMTWRFLHTRYLVFLLGLFSSSVIAFGQTPEKAIIAHTSENISLAPLLYGPLTGFSATVEKLEKNPQQVRKVLRGFLRSMKSFRHDKRDAVEFIARRFRLDGAVAEESYKIVLQSLSEDGTISQASLQEFLDGVRKEPGVKNQFTIGDLVDFRILREAAKDVDGKS
jgi:ABC-type nitrate/sulfonate/bicarbonate transport system substrate-binding protein